MSTKDNWDDDSSDDEEGGCLRSACPDPRIGAKWRTLSAVGIYKQYNFFILFIFYLRPPYASALTTKRGCRGRAPKRKQPAI